MRSIVLIVLATFVTGCSSWSSLNFLTPHKIDIQQGNAVKQADVSKLRPGMSKTEVRTLLGTPLLIDPFHNNRWDYVFRFRKGGTVTEERQFTVVFQDDKLQRIEGDIVPLPKEPGEKSAAK